MKKLLCVLLFVLLAGCAYTAVYTEDEPQELLLVYEPNEMPELLLEEPTDIHQALEEFLYPLLSIFDFGHSPECGALIADCWQNEYMTWVNRYGEIFEPDFLRIGETSLLVPWAFELYDFDNDGIPEVFITYVPRRHCGSFAALYKFIDGEFRETPFATSGSGASFFTDSASRIIMFENCGRDGIFQYSFFNLHDGGADTELILQAEFCEETGFTAWNEHHRYPYWLENPAIFGMPEETLTPIPRLTELESQLTANIRRRHGLPPETWDIPHGQCLALQRRNAASRALWEFLYPRHTLFDLGRERDSGALISILLDDELHTVVYNRYGERIDWPEYAGCCCCVPVAFFLYDFDNSGIPVVLLLYSPLFHGGSGASLYRFIDGAYVRQENIFFYISSEFFADRNGRIVVFEHNEYSGNYSFRYLDFTDTDSETTHIIDPFGNLDWYSDNRRDEWEKLWYDWAEHITSPEWYTNPTIFRMPEETLTRIPRLTEREEQLTASIRRAHGLD